MSFACSFAPFSTQARFTAYSCLRLRVVCGCAFGCICAFGCVATRESESEIEDCTLNAPNKEGLSVLCTGATPSIADYAWVPVLTMFEASHYHTLRSPQVSQYIQDFKQEVKCWEYTALLQTGFVKGVIGENGNPRK